MKILRCFLSAGILSAAVLTSSAAFSQAAPAPTQPAANMSGVHDFDFEHGEWQVHHRIKRPTNDWVEFEGTSNDRPLMDGTANVEDNEFHRPSGITRGIALRAYDPKTAQWAIWWVDERDPHGSLDPPMIGRFENGVGTFYSDSMLNGKMTRTRFLWSHITPNSARWEQALSTDAGKTWDTNWIMEFRRTK